MAFFSGNPFVRDTYTVAPRGGALACGERISIEQAAKVLRELIADADAVLVGAGAGLSTSSGLTYAGERFDKHFADFRDRFGIEDMYSGGFYPFPDVETYWAWWSRHILVNRYDVEPGQPYLDVLELLKDKDYFVITTNVDHQFQLAGIDKSRLFYTQGDYGLFQCANNCSHETIDNEEQVRAMVEQQRNMRIPSELVPTCPHCGAPLVPNLRADDNFCEDIGWHAALARYEEFRRAHASGSVLYLELGVGGNTPVIIKYPFWIATGANAQATYACLNMGEAYVPSSLAKRSLLVDGDVGEVLWRSKI